MLPDYLEPGLKLVFVGLNPGTTSDRLGHYYAGPGNQFWPFLHEAGFTDRILTPSDDAKLLDYRIGLTDMVKRASRGVADLRTTEFVFGLPDLRKKLARIQPECVCFNGKTGIAKALKAPVDFGPQAERFEGARFFVAPSTSHAFPMPREEKLSYYRQLALFAKTSS